MRPEKCPARARAGRRRAGGPTEGVTDDAAVAERSPARRSRPAEHRYLYILEDTNGAGRALVTVMVDDLDATVATIAARGIEPAARETFPGGARKAIYHDADGNELGFGDVPPGTT